MKTTIEVKGYQIVIDETDELVTVTATKDDETVEEFSLELSEEGVEGLKVVKHKTKKELSHLVNSVVKKKTSVVKSLKRKKCKTKCKTKLKMMTMMTMKKKEL